MVISSPPLYIKYILFLLILTFRKYFHSRDCHYCELMEAMELQLQY